MYYEAAFTFQRSRRSQLHWLKEVRLRELHPKLRTDLYCADEAFLTGTAAEIVPMRSVDDREIGEPGEITRKIQEIYFSTVHGEVPQYKEWLEYAGE